MAWNLHDIPDQHGRTALITGANAGLGYEAAVALAGKGARVVLACRNAAKADAAMAAIRAVHPSANLEFLSLDLASLRSVDDAASAFQTRFDRLDLLLNNAGLMATDPELTVDGFEVQFAVNHLGHFALTAKLLPLLDATPGARIVNHSSMGHRGARGTPPDARSLEGYDRWNVYFWTKLENLLFTAELQRRLTGAGRPTQALVAHPGGSRTDLGTEGNHFSNRLTRWFGPWLTQSAAQGALPLLRAATDPEAQGGAYYGPRWMVRGAPVLEVPSALARDVALAAQRWQQSVEWAGCEPV